MKAYGIVKMSSSKKLCFLISYREVKKIFFNKRKDNVIYPTIRLRKKGILLMYDFTFCTFEEGQWIYNNTPYNIFLPI